MNYEDYRLSIGFSVINLEVDKEKWISKSNSSRNESNLSMKQGMRRKRVLRRCNSKSVRRSSSLTPILQMQRNTGAEMQAFVAERDKLIKAHEKKMVSMRERHWQEEVELEKEFDAELSHLMEKYTLDGSKVNAGNT
ncbi:protein SUPPRESSOR OF GENE SILENCING 3 [Gossypium hirsutum]|uniref:Protein SUPPRESSOR OF GENE SILENCING 3 n=1 Tax=Gossypium hirsutum TaxID=3635 RepID=A0ABM2ZJS5_GOSHI|nr:protein SUPPRESSOR OF GENE SILENCING 3-like [Gossypium hirsutum]XP_040942908.1 protein SUPPRESSOR OF GENE SILENCING 3-like [Gossypium hirsutum]